MHTPQEEAFFIDSFLDINPVKFLTTTCEMSPESLMFSMEAFDFVLNALPRVRVEEKENIVHVGGFWAKDLGNDIHRSWGSARVSNSIFIELNSRSLTFHSFFVVEVLYVLEALKNYTRRKTSVKTIDDLIKNIYDNTWLTQAQLREALPHNLRNIDRQLTAKPLKAQYDFIDSYVRNVPKLNLRGSVIAAPPGTGKTLAGFFLGEALEKEVMVFIVPKNSVETVWEATIKGFYKRVPKYWISTDSQGPRGDERIFICHYESLSRLFPVAPKLTNKNSLLWLDESHNFNDEGSQRTGNFITLRDYMDANDTVWASGTPLKAIGSEAVPMLTTIDPLFTKSVRDAFVGIFGSTKGRALDILSHRLSKIMFRPEKADIIALEKEDYTLKLKPTNAFDFTLDKVREKVRAFVAERVEYYKDNMSAIESRVMGILSQVEEANKGSAAFAQEMANYRFFIGEMHRKFNFDEHKDWIPLCKKFEAKMEEDMDREQIKVFRKEIAVYKYMVLVVRGEALGLIVTRMRIDAVNSLVPFVPWKKIIDEAEKKVLVFSSYVEVVEACIEHVKALGYKPLSVYGKNNSDLTETKRLLKTNPTANPIVATYQSLSTAVEVTECNVEVFMDMPFRDHIFNQARGRIDRVGQDAKLHYISVFLDTDKETNITLRALDIMKWSKEMVDAMMGVSSEVDGSDAVSMEGFDDLLGLTEDDLVSLETNYDIELPHITKKDIWYQNLFDIPSSYFKTGVRYGG